MLLTCTPKAIVTNPLRLTSSDIWGSLVRDRRTLKRTLLVILLFLLVLPNMLACRSDVAEPTPHIDATVGNGVQATQEASNSIATRQDVNGATALPTEAPSTVPSLAPEQRTTPTARPTAATIAAQALTPTTVPTATPVPTAVPSSTPVIPLTPTPTTIPTATPVPTAVPSNTPVIPLTPTPTLTPTATPVPTAAPTPTLALTATPLPPPPDSLGLNPFYVKYLDAGGIPVLASEDVPDQALFRARDIIDEMLANRPDIRAALAESGRRVSVVADGEAITDIPEFQDLYEEYPATDWNERIRSGLSGNREDPTTAIYARNLLCQENDAHPSEDIFVHEFAHTVLRFGVEGQPNGKDFRRRLEKNYQDALEDGLWVETYAGRNPDEYWAEGVQSWFGLNARPGTIHNDVNTRSELEPYDPVLAEMIREVFGDSEVVSSCHEPQDISFEFNIQGVIASQDGHPLQGLILWAWQGSRSNSGISRTGPEGTFYIRVPEGSFTLDIYASSPSGCVGWYDGKKSITTRRDERAKVLVDGASISGIDIKLPLLPAELPRIRC